MKRLLLVLFMLMMNECLAVTSIPSITELKNNRKANEIALLDNRFRIDHKVEKITLLFFRKLGSPAVILVKPDGSKIYANYAIKNEHLEWFDESSYDLITIENPMPGPWQVIGRIQQDSRIMVLGDIELVVEPLPALLFRGETLKVTGKVTNDGKPVDVGYFKDVVRLIVEFVSTNNELYDNFNAGTRSVAEFKDDGRDFDERPMDGIFTGEFRLGFSAGEWQPEFYIETPILKRRVVHSPIVISEPPFDYQMSLGRNAESSHELLINLDQDILKSESVIFQGKIYYPNGEEQFFTLDSENRLYRKLEISNYGWGRYQVELSVFGENTNGREFMAKLPNYNFEIERPIKKVPELQESKVNSLLPQHPPIAPKSSMSKGLLIGIIVLGNILVMLLGWLVIRIFVQNKPIKLKLSLPSFKKKISAEDESENENEKESNGSKNDKSGDILNLSVDRD
jgi:uncharacterized protein (TIGR03503 family)